MLPVGYDILRLFLATMSPAPRGIDRVDLMLAEHFFCQEERGVWGVLPTPWGVRVYDRHRVRSGLDHLKRLWRERKDSGGSDERFEWVIARLAGCESGRAALKTQGVTFVNKLHRMFRHLRTTGFSLGEPIRKALPADAVYLNVGHLGLAIPGMLNWLEDRRDVTSVMMLHDAIPLETPDLVDPASVKFHANMIQSASRFAQGIICTTQHAKGCIESVLSANRVGGNEFLVRGLPLSETLTAPGSPHPALLGARYLVVISAIEPRKNHAMLFEVWRRLKASSGERAPHLVVVGSAAWEGHQILAQIDQMDLADRVHHVSGLSSPALAQLVLGAMGVLSPSLAEGFGLSVLEGDTLGVPVIASDIDSHREIAGERTQLLDARDIDAWLAAIRELSIPSHLRTTPKIPKALTPSFYCRDVENFLDKVAATRRTAIRP